MQKLCDRAQFRYEFSEILVWVLDQIRYGFESWENQLKSIKIEERIWRDFSSVVRVRHVKQLRKEMAFSRIGVPKIDVFECFLDICILLCLLHEVHFEVVDLGLAKYGVIDESDWGNIELKGGVKGKRRRSPLPIGKFWNCADSLLASWTGCHHEIDCSLQLRAKVLCHLLNLFLVSDSKVRKEFIAECNSNRIIIANNSPFFNIVRT